MKKLAIALILVASTIVAACSSDTTTTSSSSGTSGTSGGTSGTAPTGNVIEVKSNLFNPAAITIKKGETVTWTWKGGSHNVVSGKNCTDDKAYTSGAPTSATGNTFTHTYNDVGTFEYFCDPHCTSSGMKGTVTVQ